MNVRARADMIKVEENRFSIEVPSFRVGARKPMFLVVQDLGQGVLSGLLNDSGNLSTGGD